MELFWAVGVDTTGWYAYAAYPTRAEADAKLRLGFGPSTFRQAHLKTDLREWLWFDVIVAGAASDMYYEMWQRVAPVYEARYGIEARRRIDECHKCHDQTPDILVSDDFPRFYGRRDKGFVLVDTSELHPYEEFQRRAGHGIVTAATVLSFSKPEAATVEFDDEALFQTAQRVTPFAIRRFASIPGWLSRPEYYVSPSTELDGWALGAPPGYGEHVVMTQCSGYRVSSKCRQGRLKIEQGTGEFGQRELIPSNVVELATICDQPALFVQGHWADSGDDYRNVDGRWLWNEWDRSIDRARLTWVEGDVTFVVRAHDLGLNRLGMEELFQSFR